jgi:peptide/nickel transport system substrate-binding protein
MSASRLAPRLHQVRGLRAAPDGAREWTSGPKTVHFDRVEWTVMPDSATATNALMAGESDWQEYAYHNLLSAHAAEPQRAGEGARQVRLRRHGAREPHPAALQQPRDPPRVVERHRPGLLHAGAGGPAETSLYHTPLGFFGPGTPMASDAGLEPLVGPRDYGKARQALLAAGYNNEPVLLMIPSTSEPNSLMGAVVTDTFKQVGLNVEVYSVEFNAMLQRRNRRGTIAEGGWSAFVTNWVGTDWLNPAGHIALRGNGDAGYGGWANMPRIEELRDAWFQAPDLAAQQAICRDIQLEAMREVPYYPLGQYLQPTAFRSNIRDVNEGFATFWNVRRA